MEGKVKLPLSWELPGFEAAGFSWRRDFREPSRFDV